MCATPIMFSLEVRNDFMLSQEPTIQFTNTPKQITLLANIRKYYTEHPKRGSPATKFSTERGVQYWVGHTKATRVAACCRINSLVYREAMRLVSDGLYPTWIHGENIYYPKSSDPEQERNRCYLPVELTYMALMQTTIEDEMRVAHEARLVSARGLF